MEDKKLPLSVRALTKYIKLKFDYDQNLQGVLLKGEISNFKRHSRGHFYFTLKDEEAQVSAVMFAQAAKAVGFTPKDGMEVIVKGSLSVYEAGGSYSIQVRSIKEDGVGNLFVAFNQMKERLGREGLFDQARKMPLPKFPASVGIITSPTGAAIRDVLSTIRRRFPATQIFIYPALVQGENAAASIVSCIRQANEGIRPDVIILGRGGGSIEDLWAFNEEAVARAIFQSKVPIISAVGHETDFTIADFVADLRAPTPTGAAEMAVPSLPDVLAYYNQLTGRLSQNLSNQLNQKKEKLDRLANHYILKNPNTLFEPKMMHVDKLTEKLQHLLQDTQSKKAFRLQSAQARLGHFPPGRVIEAKRQRFVFMQALLTQSMEKKMSQSKTGYGQALAMLQLLNPLAVLAKGYGVMADGEGKAVRSVSQLKVGEAVRATVADGNFLAVVEEIIEN
ncbi:MAG: exodeoxyribonuclease VII large subunit [Turicibacter sp.]|nr:exodeoxyribonuclease VII large subunit [Turicibacter sp.]